MAISQKKITIPARAKKSTSARAVKNEKRIVAVQAKPKTRVKRKSKLLVSRRTSALRAQPLPRFAAIQKHESNPIIEPRQENFWEMKATFNPAAAAVGGRVYLLYRAIGGDDVSTLGCAVSNDGVTIAERPGTFVFEHRTRGAQPLTTVPKINYLSGGGSVGGCEDPRLTVIDEDGRVYLTYTAFDGWGSVRIGLSSISTEDFVNQRWRWSEPVFLSPPNQVHKNWVLFPEKINGKYAILHSISPELSVAYIDDLSEFEDEERNIESQYRRLPSTGRWDSWLRGAGPPPIRTRLGWLLFYHAMDVRDPNRYKLGAMILDIADPTKVLYRSQVPILEPEEWYENTGWKSGVVYSCGAVVKEGELYVYYGGADSVVCVAVANLEHFLNELTRSGAPQLVKKSDDKATK